MENQPQPHPALTKEIKKYVKSGYRVVNQTNTTAQLVRPKRFSCLWASLWFLALGIGLIFYLFYYKGKSDDIIYLEVIDNKVRVTRG